MAAVPRPDICARFAGIASRTHSLCGSDVCRIHELTQVVKEWQRATALGYASPSHPAKRLGLDGKAMNNVCDWGRESHCGTAPLPGWRDAACGDQSTAGKCRLGCVIGLTSPSLTGPCHISRRTSAFTRELVKSSLDGKVNAQSEAVDHMSLPRDFYALFESLAPE